jgi:hypothetical protein
LHEPVSPSEPLDIGRVFYQRFFYHSTLGRESTPEESSYYRDWAIRKLFIVVPAQEGMAKYLETFKKFPPRQKPASYTIDQVMEMMMRGINANK